MDKWAFGTLGPLEVRRNGAPLTLSAAKHRIVLATLVLRVGETVSVDQLVTSLWEGEPPSGARSTCQAYVMRLRQALGDPEAVVTRHGGYLLNVDPAQVDHVRFAELVAQARRTGEAIHALTESLSDAAQAAQQIFVTAQEQSVGVDQVGLAMDNIRQVATQNMAATRQVERAARDMNVLAQQFKALVTGAPGRPNGLAAPDEVA